MQILNERSLPNGMFDDRLEMHHIVTTLRRCKWTIVGFAVLAALVAGVVALRMTPVYRSSATLLIEAGTPNVIAQNSTPDNDGRNQQYYETQFEILGSRPIIEKVVHRLDLADNPEFETAPAPWSSWLTQLGLKTQQTRSANEQLIDTYQRRLTVLPIPKTQLVTVSFDAHDPDLAAAIANAHAQAFIENYMQDKEATTHSTSEWLVGRAEELRKQLAESEKKLQDFREREHLLDVDSDIQALPARELNELSTKLIEARRELSENRNIYEQVESARYAPLEEKLAIPAVSADPLVKQYRQVRAEAAAQVAELAKRYGPQHPKMQAAHSALEAAQRTLAEQVDSVMDSIRNQQQVLRGQEGAVAAALNSAKAAVQSTSSKEAQYQALQQEVATNRDLYTMFYKRISETKATGELNTRSARVISPATADPDPVKPKKTLIVAFSFLAALIVGVASVLVADLLDTRVKNERDVAQKIGEPLLGIVPKTRKRWRRKSVGRGYTEGRDKKFGEAIRTLRTAMSLNDLDMPQKVLMVCSSCGNEGKTSVACNLALACAQVERVLLIDGDLRRSSVAKVFGIDVHNPGLAELCMGTASESDCIVRQENEQLDVLPAGLSPKSPQELLVSRRFDEVLNGLLQRYDRIIIDSSPVLPVSDALLLAGRVDALIYVVKFDATTAMQVQAGLQLFRRTQVQIKGIVLNQVDLKKIAQYGSAYSYGSYELERLH